MKFPYGFEILEIKPWKTLCSEVPFVKFWPHGGYDPISRAPNRISGRRTCGEYPMLTLFARLQYTYYGQGGRGDAEAAINITWFCGKGMSRFEVDILCSFTWRCISHST